MQNQINTAPAVDNNSLRNAQYGKVKAKVTTVPFLTDSLDTILAAVANMLHLNLPEEPSATSGPENIVWKVLIFDKFGQDIISSIMRVNDLRENGVTVHM
jgi:hypothetical protein